LKRAVAYKVATAEERTEYQPSLKGDRNVAAQRTTGTLNAGTPFSVVTPQSEIERVDLPKRTDQGPPSIVSHAPMQTDPGTDKLLSDDKVRSMQPFKFPALPAPSFRSQTLRVWEGVIVDLGTAKFKAVLTDVEHPGFGRESGEFYLTEVSENDRELVQLGAVFYWYVGVEITKSHRLKEVTALRFRRLPGWSAQQVKSVEEEAGRLEELFGSKGRRRTTA
jgi:hypothetical protein